MRSLTYRQRLFVAFYLGESSRSPVDAARRAGYRWPEKLGPRLVRKSGIQAAIDARVATAAMTSSEILARLADVAAANMLDLIVASKRGLHTLDPMLVKRLGLGHVIKRLRMNKDGTQDIELEPRSPALVRLGEHYKLWKGAAEPELTLVELAKSLKERYDQLRKQECDDRFAKPLSGPTGSVQ